LGRDIFVRDMVTNVTKLVTVNLAGSASGNGTSLEAKISADGRYVVFTSEASNLVENDTATRDVFIRDLQTNITKRVSTNAAGTAGGNGESGGGIIDKSGRFVVFSTRATDLSTLPDTNGLAEVFIYDIQNDSKKLITVNTTGTATGGGFGPFGGFDHGVDLSISADGRFVAFMSQQSGLVTNDTNEGGDDIFLYNIATQTKSLVSVNLTGTSGNVGGSFRPSISDDGRYVAFDSLSSDLVSTPDEPNGFTSDVFLRDVVKGETYLVSVNSAGTRTGNGFSSQALLTSDGKRLVFLSNASNLITNDLNGFAMDVFVFTFTNAGAPHLLREENSERAIALDSVTQAADPFPFLNFNNFSMDQRSRISLFVWGLELQPGEDKSAVTVKLENTQGTTFIPTVEYVGDQPGLTGTKQVVIRLPDGATGDLFATVNIRGLTSNRALLKINP
jgi:Tol biopolymer transport system component